MEGRPASERAALASNPLWHFAFHYAPGDLAEPFTFDRERGDLDRFYDRIAVGNPRAVDEAVVGFLEENAPRPAVCPGSVRGEYAR